MDLKTGKPLWPEITPPMETHAPLNRAERCDVLIIGSGITGALFASTLAESGLNVIVVDRRDIASGSTPASTAMVMYDLDIPLVQLAERIGETNAQRAYRRSERAVGDFLEIAQSLKTDVLPRGCVYLAGGNSDCRLLEDEVAARQALGIDVEMLDEKSLASRFRIRRAGALLSRRALEVNPLGITHALLAKAQRLGTRIFPRTQIDHVEPAADHVALRTDHGHALLARHVIFASGYETPEILKGSYCRLKSTYVLASQPLREGQLWPERVLIWEHRTPYFYARTTPDSRILCGGEDEDFADPELRDSLLEIKTRTLLARLRSLAPWLDPRAEFAWAGTFAETEDGLPLIGSVPELPNCHFALGYGGNGMTFSLIAAQVIHKTILGSRDEEADLFSFDRLAADPKPQRNASPWHQASPTTSSSLF